MASAGVCVAGTGGKGDRLEAYCLSAVEFVIKNHGQRALATLISFFHGNCAVRVPGMSAYRSTVSTYRLFASLAIKTETEKTMAGK